MKCIEIKVTILNDNDLTVLVSKIDKHIEIDVYKVNEPLFIVCTPIYTLEVNAFRIDEPLCVVCDFICPIEIKTARIDEPLCVTYSFVCSINDKYYLHVLPDSTIWLDLDSIDIFVESNVSWIIE